MAGTITLVVNDVCCPYQLRIIASSKLHHHQSPVARHCSLMLATLHFLWLDSRPNFDTKINADTSRMIKAEPKEKFYQRSELDLTCHLVTQHSGRKQVTGHKKQNLLIRTVHVVPSCAQFHHLC